jgi:hypothetical protein
MRAMSPRPRDPLRLLAALALAAALLALTGPAAAFCGFYVGGADKKLYNNATIVVLMREGTRTVLSMQNNYQGPPDDFAMVVPVPVVLQKENVRTLPREVFDAVDRAAAPRLVEYWEEDPCPPPDLSRRVYESASMSDAAPPPGASLGVKVEAEFVVGEYNVVILSAEDALGLDTWLRRESYKIPEGAEATLRPYVEGGMKFFVAKVIASKVAFKDGQAMLSPLRFHYDSEGFSLPIRLGLVNSSGTQDLLIHILAQKRYEVANYPNVTIPTNLDVAEEARDRFGEFYAALFDETLKQHPGSVVTEYAWSASSCDPCPGPVLSGAELETLGLDALRAAQDRPAQWWPNLVLTRLHARYTKEALGQDLVFREAPPIQGGQEIRDRQGALSTGAQPSTWGSNSFQGRYAIRHPWKGPITCLSPKRGVWGGPPDGLDKQSGTKPARDLAFAPRGKASLASFLVSDAADLGIRAEGATPTGAPWTVWTWAKLSIMTLIAAAIGLFVWRRRRRARGAASP